MIERADGFGFRYGLVFYRSVVAMKWTLNVRINSVRSDQLAGLSRVVPRRFGHPVGLVPTR